MIMNNEDHSFFTEYGLLGVEDVMLQEVSLIS